MPKKQKTAIDWFGTNTNQASQVYSEGQRDLRISLSNESDFCRKVKVMLFKSIPISQSLHSTPMIGWNECSSRTTTGKHSKPCHVLQALSDLSEPSSEHAKQTSRAIYAPDGSKRRTDTTCYLQFQQGLSGELRNHSALHPLWRRCRNNTEKRFCARALGIKHELFMQVPQCIFNH